MVQRRVTHRADQPGARVLKLRIGNHIRPNPAKSPDFCRMSRLKAVVLYAFASATAAESYNAKSSSRRNIKKSRARVTPTVARALGLCAQRGGAERCYPSRHVIEPYQEKWHKMALSRRGRRRHFRFMGRGLST